MFTGQILVYRYNGLQQAKPGVKRNNFTLKNINVETKQEFQMAIQDSLDEIPAGQGYSLVKWNGRMFVCERDANDHSVDYVRHEITWHPLEKEFTV